MKRISDAKNRSLVKVRGCDDMSFKKVLLISVLLIFVPTILAIGAELRPMNGFGPLLTLVFKVLSVIGGIMLTYATYRGLKVIYKLEFSEGKATLYYYLSSILLSAIFVIISILLLALFTVLIISSSIFAIIGLIFGLIVFIVYSSIASPIYVVIVSDMANNRYDFVGSFSYAIKLGFKHFKTLFIFNLTFIGWFFLSVFTLGALYYFVYPYYYFALYELLEGEMDREEN